VANNEQKIEAGTEFQGAIRSQCAVVVDGVLNGEVEAPSLTVTSNGSAHGKMQVKELRSEGSLGGQIEADRVELSGTIENNTVIRATTLEVKIVESGATAKFGDCELFVGDPTTARTTDLTNGVVNKDAIQPVNV